ncbi:MAG: LPS export ABC transporter ATP-binding protein [Pseudomonadota bacterium]
MHLLRASNLAKSYKSNTVVRDVSIELASGQVVGLLGANGAGKTTSFYMVVGLVTHDKGEITLDNQNIGHLPMHKRAQIGIGYLPQEPSIFRKLTVEQNILAILETRADIDKVAQKNLLEKLLGEFNIGHIRNSLGVSLSGGERRRVEIARALAANPKFILLDEPFAGVDPISVNDIKQIINHLTERGLGVLITDHRVEATLEVCDQVYIVNEGRTIAQGSPENILNNTEVRDVYLGNEFKL